MSTDVTVDITITFNSGVVQPLLTQETEHGCNALEKLLKLYTTRTTTNMHMFDETEKLRKFETPEEIVDCYMGPRRQAYADRKKHQIGILTREATILSNKARFIAAILDDSLDLRRKKKDVVSAMLAAAGYDVVDGDEDFKYLVRLPMDSVTEENVEKIMKERDSKLAELEALKATSEESIWLSELVELRKEYMDYKTARASASVAAPSKKKLKLKSSGKKKKKA